MEFLSPSFSYQQGSLYCGKVALADIAARAGTPVYVYCAQDIAGAFRAYDQGLEGVPHKVCYAVKANSNLSVIHLLVRVGAGFDIVSGGELFRVLKAGGRASDVVFSGVGKTADEVEYALREGIHSFNCESEAELALIDAKASRLGKRASVAVRINPDVDAETHPYISTGLRQHKFGVDISGIESLYERGRALRNLVLEGVSCHIGSQLTSTAPLLDALDKMLAAAERLRALGHAIRYLDLGGGLGVPYRPGQKAADIGSYVASVRERLAGRDLTLLLEPGRSIVARAGVLLTRVLYRKENRGKQFVVVDAAMTDLIRPSLYKAWHEILPVRQTGMGTIVADVVGPVCETGDFLAQDREVANALPGDVLAVCTAGAYGMVAASNYNSRPRPAEVLVEGDSWRVVRARETYEDLIRGEKIPEPLEPR
jgi:diaminopimelate decarboxylase